MDIRSTNLPGRSRNVRHVGSIPEMRFIPGFCLSRGVQDLKLQDLICLMQLLKSGTKRTTVAQKMLAGN